MGQLYLDGDLKNTFQEDSREEVSEKIFEAIQKADSEAKFIKAVIGTLPKRGDIITVNELEFKVISSDNLKGKFIAKIRKPLNQEE